MKETHEIEIDSNTYKIIEQRLNERNSKVNEHDELTPGEYMGLLLEKHLIKERYVELKKEVDVLEIELKRLDNTLEGKEKTYLDLFTIDELLEHSKMLEHALKE